MRLLIHKLFWPSRDGFNIASCVAPQTRYLHSIQIWRVIRWHVPFQSFANSSHGGIVERHVQCAQSAMHFVQSAATSGSGRLLFSMNLGAEIDEQLQLLFATTLTLKLHHSDVIVAPQMVGGLV